MHQRRPVPAAAPTVFVEAGRSKNRKRTLLPIRAELVTELTQWFETASFVPSVFDGGMGNREAVRSTRTHEASAQSSWEQPADAERFELEAGNEAERDSVQVASSRLEAAATTGQRTLAPETTAPENHGKPTTSRAL
jgi:hypothetical protein